MEKSKRKNSLFRKNSFQLYPNQSFASGLNFYKLFWVFFIGCIAGVIIETIWCLITRFHYESRTGLIYGPFNLVYGFGALLMTVCLYCLRNRRDLWIIIGGLAIGTVFEYVCSYLQEVLFGTVSWEYSKFPFNLHGRVNMLYSLFWGVLALVWVKNLFPLITEYIEKIPNSFGKVLTWFLLIFMIINTFMSACVVGRMAGRYENISPSNKFEEYIDKKYPDERVKNIYPNMIHVD